MALAALTEAIHLDPRSPALKSRAILYLSLGRFDQAVRDLDQAIAAMQSVAQSARVTYSDYQSLTAKEGSYARARSSVGISTSHFPDPETYYTQHLRGFFRGGAVSKKAAQATLDVDLWAIERDASDTSAQTDVLHRDVRLLQQWVAFWSDLIEFEIVPVAPSPETRGAIPTIFALTWQSRVQGSVTYFWYKNQAAAAAMATTINVTRYL